MDSEQYMEFYEPYGFKNAKKNPVKKAPNKNWKADWKANLKKNKKLGIEKVVKTKEEKKEAADRKKEEAEEKEKLKTPKQIEQERKEVNKSLVIVVKIQKTYTDLLKYLYQYFVKKDNGLGFFDDRLRLHLSSHKEWARRDAVFDPDTNDYANNPYGNADVKSS